MLRLIPLVDLTVDVIERHQPLRCPEAGLKTGFPPDCYTITSTLNLPAEAIQAGFPAKFLPNLQGVLRDCFR